MRETNAAKAKKAQESLAEECAVRGFSIVGNYVNAKTKIDMKCPSGHSVSITPSNFKKGRGCPSCSRKGSNYGKKTFEKAISENGFTLIGEYSGASNQVDVRCPSGHITTISPQVIKRGGMACRVCANNDPLEAERNLNDLAERCNFSIKSAYLGAHKDLLMTCPLGHDFFITPKNFKSGQRCSVCKGKDRRFAYLHAVEAEGFEFVKFGVATNHKLRLTHQRMQNKNAVISVIGVWEFENPTSCKQTEVEIKKKIKCAVVGRDVMPSGYTETCSVKSMGDIVKIFESLGGSRRG